MQVYQYLHHQIFIDYVVPGTVFFISFSPRQCRLENIVLTPHNNWKCLW